MKSIFLILLPLSLAVAGCSNITFNNDKVGKKTTACQVGDFSKDDLKRIKQSEFKDVTDEEVNEFALNLLSCVGDPDPEIRDGIVYESLSFLLRNEKLSDATKIKLTTSLLDVLQGPDDKKGFLKPFAALDLSELARADRIRPYLNTEQRASLVSTTATYMRQIDDYRGYDNKVGWRHAVAHTSDIMLQLSLNDNVTIQQLLGLSQALATQVSPDNGHAYIHGESERLARPILYMARRGKLSQLEWDTWFAQIADPAPFKTWNEVFTSEAGLAKLHNTKAFVNAIYVNASASENENLIVLRNSALSVLTKLP